MSILDRFSALTATVGPISDELRTQIIQNVQQFCGSSPESAQLRTLLVEGASNCARGGFDPALGLSWLTCLSDLFTALPTGSCTSLDLLQWVWSCATSTCTSALSSFHEFHASRAACIDSVASGMDISIHQVREDDSSVEAALTEASKAAVSLLGVASSHLSVALEALGPSPDDSACECICTMIVDALTLDGFVQFNFPLKNWVWKCVASVAGPWCVRLATCAPGECRFPYDTATTSVLNHIDESLNALVEGGVLCDDPKAAAKHVRILRFMTGHLSTLLAKHSHTLTHVAAQWTRIVLLDVRCRQITGACPGGHPVQDSLAQFICPVLDLLTLRLFQMPHEDGWAKDALTFLATKPFGDAAYTDVTVATHPDSVQHCDIGTTSVFLSLCYHNSGLPATVIADMMKALPALLSRLLGCYRVLVIGANAPDDPFSQGTVGNVVAAALAVDSTTTPVSLPFTIDMVTAQLMCLIAGHVEHYPAQVMEFIVAALCQDHILSTTLSIRLAVALAQDGRTVPCSVLLAGLLAQTTFIVKRDTHRNNVCRCLGVLTAVLPAEYQFSIVSHCPKTLISGSVDTLTAVAALFKWMPVAAWSNTTCASWKPLFGSTFRDAAMVLAFAADDGVRDAGLAAPCLAILHSGFTWSVSNPSACGEVELPASTRQAALMCALSVVRWTLQCSKSDSVVTMSANQAAFCEAIGYISACQSQLSPAQMCGVTFAVGLGVAVAQVVSSLGTINAPPPHQDRIRAEVQQLFEALMRHDQVTVRWAGCRAFTRFLAASPLPDVQSMLVPECLDLVHQIVSAAAGTVDDATCDRLECLETESNAMLKTAELQLLCRVGSKPCDDPRAQLSSAIAACKSSLQGALATVRQCSMRGWISSENDWMQDAEALTVLTESLRSELCGQPFGPE